MLKGAARGNQNPGLEALSVQQLLKKHPALKEILKQMGVPLQGGKTSSFAYLCEEAGVDPAAVFARLNGKNKIQEDSLLIVDRLTIIPGKNKSGEREYETEIIIKRGEIVALVGPTGSGKSQLLNDIEGLVQGDSPSRRSILLDDNTLDDKSRLERKNRHVTQISQNMNYLIDLPVGDFLDIHMESRNIKKPLGWKKNLVKEACTLCGEPFTLATPLVTLSGGQARSLMIADSLFISRAPLVLVDEIENAGIDREKAVKLLLRGTNITIIATHDPLIALLAHKRIILKNGGISQIIEKSCAETTTLEYLSVIEQRMIRLKKALREGQELSLPNDV